MADTGFENHVLIEASDCNLDFYELIYDIQHERPELGMAEKYELAVRTLNHLLDRGLIRIVEVELETVDAHTRRALRETTVTPVDAPALLRDAQTWDRSVAIHNRIVHQIALTPKGERRLDQLQR